MCVCVVVSVYCLLAAFSGDSEVHAGACAKRHTVLPALALGLSLVEISRSEESTVGAGWGASNGHTHTRTHTHTHSTSTIPDAGIHNVEVTKAPTVSASFWHTRARILVKRGWRGGRRRGV